MATFIVNTTVDENDGSVVDGDVSLRDAIAAASAGDQIEFDASVFAADGDELTNTTIALTLGTLTLTQRIKLDGDVNHAGVADVTIDLSVNGGGRNFYVGYGAREAKAWLLEALQTYSVAGLRRTPPMKMRRYCGRATFSVPLKWIIFFKIGAEAGRIQRGGGGLMLGAPYGFSRIRFAYW